MSLALGQHHVGDHISMDGADGEGVDSVFDGEVFSEAQNHARDGGTGGRSESLDLSQAMLSSMLPDLDSSLVAELVRSGSLPEESPGGVWENPRGSRRPEALRRVGGGLR